MAPSIVFNSQIDQYGRRFITKEAPVPPGLVEGVEKAKALGSFFEQILLFDKVAIKADRQNVALYFLIRELGINRIEDLLRKDLLRVVLWTPQLMTLTEPANQEGSRPGIPPVIGGGLSGMDADPEYNVQQLLSHFTNLHRDRRRIFIQAAVERYTVPNWRFANDAATIVIDAYKQNRLAPMGLSYEKEPDQLILHERQKLLDLGSDILEASILAECKLKGYGGRAAFELTKAALLEVEGALRVTENTSKVLNLENAVSVQELFLSGRVPFERVFDLRYLNEVKEYRRWINSVSTNTDATQIATAFLDAVEGNLGKLSSGPGKFLRMLSMFVMGSGLSAALGTGAGLAAGLGLTAFDSYVLEAINRGYNPRLFVQLIKSEGGGGIAS